LLAAHGTKDLAHGARIARNVSAPPYERVERVTEQDQLAPEVMIIDCNLPSDARVRRFDR
jgi:hypothetical protein